MHTRASRLVSISLALFTILLIIASHIILYAYEPQKPNEPTRKLYHAPGEIIIRLDASANQDLLNDIIRSRGGTIIDIEKTRDDGRLELVKFPNAPLEVLEQISHEIALQVSGILDVSAHWKPGMLER